MLKKWSTTQNTLCWVKRLFQCCFVSETPLAVLSLLGDTTKSRSWCRWWAALQAYNYWLARLVGKKRWLRWVSLFGFVVVHVLFENRSCVYDDSDDILIGSTWVLILFALLFFVRYSWFSSTKFYCWCCSFAWLFVSSSISADIFFARFFMTPALHSLSTRCDVPFFSCMIFESRWFFSWASLNLFSDQKEFWWRRGRKERYKKIERIKAGNYDSVSWFPASTQESLKLLHLKTPSSSCWIESNSDTDELEWWHHDNIRLLMLCWTMMSERRQVINGKFVTNRGKTCNVMCGFERRVGKSQSRKCLLPF